MKKMAWPFHIFSVFLHLLCVTVATQEPTETLTLYNSKSSLNHASLGIFVGNHDLNEVSSSVLMAENWLKTHVLLYYPSSEITHILVGHNLLCFPQTHETVSQRFHLILPAMKNLHHSLTRWGLEREIKVSPSLSSHCFAPNLIESLIKPLLHFIQVTNSTYLVNPFEPISDHKIESFLVSTHIKKMGFLVLKPQKQANPTMRKLTSSSLPPLIGPLSPFSEPHLGLSPAEAQLPHHHHHQHQPAPCNPWSVPAPAPEMGEKTWCVAKPSVPEETLQEAMDYACGEGGAECDEIQPNGSCFYPNTLVAHASFAFNSYWQKTKINGGTCSFGGTAMVINSDPSFLQCRFIVS